MMMPVPPPSACAAARRRRRITDFAIFAVGNQRRKFGLFARDAQRTWSCVGGSQAATLSTVWKSPARSAREHRMIRKTSYPKHRIFSVLSGYLPSRALVFVLTSAQGHRNPRSSPQNPHLSSRTHTLRSPTLTLVSHRRHRLRFRIRVVQRALGHPMVTRCNCRAPR